MKDRSKTSHPRIKATQCEKGKLIRHERAQAVRIATIDTWWSAEGKGWLKYCRHVSKCKQCGDFEAVKRAKQLARFEKQEKTK
jgi:hypothetical protein